MAQPNRVLIIGEDPDLVDFSDPTIPPGMTARKVRAALDAALAQLRARGRKAELVLTTSEQAAAGEVTAALEGKSYDCVVVGAGLRIVPKMTRTFEVIINVVHERAPRARLAFNVSPDDSADAAERQLGQAR